MEIKFEVLDKKHLDLVARLYNYYIVNSTATFHTHAVDADELLDIIPIDHPRYKSFLIKVQEKMVGYCYISNFKPREAYDRTAEITVYINPKNTGKGIGRSAISFLEEIANKVGVKVFMATITANNEGSIKLFKSLDYRQCAHFHQVGTKFGKVLDVKVFQKNL